MPEASIFVRCCYKGYSLTDKNNLDEPATWGGWGDY